MNDDKIKILVPLREAARRKAEAARKADKYVGKDGGPPSPDIVGVLDELGEMSPAEYGRRRPEIADKIGTSRTFLDAEYRERRKAAKDGGDSEFLRDPDPWPEAVKGDDLLDEIRNVAAKHIVLPEGGAEIIALWTLFAHCHDCFDISPILALTSPTPECGKTTCLNLLGSITPRALSASNISPSSIFRSVEKWYPTLLVDEADTYVRDNDEIRGVLNCGHHRSGAFVIRTVGDNHEPKRFCTWSPKAIGLIGKLPPTLASRAIHVALKRMLPGDRIEPLRQGRTRHLDPLKGKAARWAKDHANQLRASEPSMPEALYGRVADNWRPLLAIADLAGGDWPALVRIVAEKLGGRQEDLAPIMVLEDLAAIFAEKGVEMLKSEEATEALGKMEHRPWPEWKNQKPITTRQLAKLLEPFGITPKQHWLGSANRRGYHVDQFQDAFKRWLGGENPLCRYNPSKSAIFSDSMPLEADTGLADLEAKKPQKANASSGIAAKNPPAGVLRDSDPPSKGANPESGHLSKDAGSDAFEERAAILEYDVGLTRAEAEALAAEEMPDLPAFLDRRAGIR